MSEIEMRPDIAEAYTRGKNDSWLNNNIDPGAFRKPDFYVYIYSISSKAHERRIPPAWPLMILKACPADKEYVPVLTLEHPLQQSDRDVDTGEVRVRFHDARRVAQDIICPDAANMDSPLPANSYTVDLRQQGVFWSLNNPPLDSEVAAARKRLETYYRGRLERNVALEYSNPKELADRLNEDDHLAADYFGEEYSWHKKRVKKVTQAAKISCPECGDEIKVGVAFHKDSETGDYCILDWKRAYEAGRVTKKQVPDTKKWEGFAAD